MVFTCCVPKNTIVEYRKKYTVIYYIPKFFRDKRVDQYFLKYNNTLYHVILLTLKNSIFYGKMSFDNLSTLFHSSFTHTFIVLICKLKLQARLH